MITATAPLREIYDGWDGHEQALMNAITPLTPEQLAFRPAPHLRSAGEIISHIAIGRLDWFHRMGAPGSGALARRFAPWETEQVNTEDAEALFRWMRAVEQQEAKIVANLAELVEWMQTSWQVIATTLTTWTVADLDKTYRHIYNGKLYSVSRQWTIWRIMSHDMHHGGELAIMLGMQNVPIPDLGEQGGHLTELPLASSSDAV
jgi:uncharacterized damage-inducible protein DinB